MKSSRGAEREALRAAVANARLRHAEALIDGKHVNPRSRNSVASTRAGKTSGIGEYMRELKDEVARQAEAGRPITFPRDALRYRDADERASLVAMLEALGVRLT